MISVRDKQQKKVFNCCADTFDVGDALYIQKKAHNSPQNTIVVNLEGVSSIKNNSLELLKDISKQNELSLCSLDADVFAVMNLLCYDKYFKIYPNEESSLDETNELKNRRFKIV